VVDREFRWQESERTWRFLNNGLIADGATRYPWFPLDEHEVLVRHRDGLKFNSDRSLCQVHYLPAGQPGKGIVLIEVK